MSEEDVPRHDIGMTGELDLGDVAAAMNLTEVESQIPQRFAEMIEQFKQDNSGREITFPARGDKPPIDAGSLEVDDSSPQELLCYALPLDIDESAGRETAHLALFPDGLMVRLEDRHGEEDYQEKFGAATEAYRWDAMKISDYASARSHFLDMNHRHITHRSTDPYSGGDFHGFLTSAFTNAKEHPPKERQERVKTTMLGNAKTAMDVFGEFYPQAKPSSGEPSASPTQQ